MEKQTKFRNLGIMLDMSRNAVMKPEVVREYIDLIADLGYNFLMLYTEDTYEVDNQPYFGHYRGRYSREELRGLDAYAKEKGIELIPCIQTLAHLGSIFRWKAYAEVHDCGDVLLCEEEKTYQLLEDMFASLDKTFTSRTVNIGMDEALMLGRGKYFTLHGAVDKFDILLKHLNKVSEIAKKYNFQLLMWGDMFFRLLSKTGDYYDDAEMNVPEKVRAMIPDNVNLIYWDYYSKNQTRYANAIKSHAAIKDDIWFAGGLWTWTGFAPHNQFSIDATTAAFNACFEQGVEDVILTIWGDDGAECSYFAILPSLYFASEMAKGNTDMDSIKQGFEAKYGIPFDDFMLLDLPLTPNGNPHVITCDKYFFYNDCFMGVFDNLVGEQDGANFGKMAEALEAVKENKYSYIFKNLAALCRVLEKKVNLGNQTRNAYKANDMDTLKAMVAEFDDAIARTEVFYDTLEERWMTENKPQGFDIQDIRIGGLLKRLQHSKKRLTQFINGEIDRLEELEEEVLDKMNRDENGPLYFNSWSGTATCNVL